MGPVVTGGISREQQMADWAWQAFEEAKANINMTSGGNSTTTFIKEPLTEAPNYTRENFTKTFKTTTTKVETEGWSPPTNITFTDDDDGAAFKPKSKSDGPPPGMNMTMKWTKVMVPSNI